MISSDAVQHDMDAVGFGYQLGEIPRMECSVFQADAALIKRRRKPAKRPIRISNALPGGFLSGDQFISSDQKKHWLIENFGGYCAEMEGRMARQHT